MHQTTSTCTPETLVSCLWLEYLLLGDLRQALDGPQTASGRQWLFALVDAFVKNLSRLSVLRNDGGSMCRMLAEIPRWQREIASLSDAGAAGRRRLEELRARLRLGLPCEAVGKAVQSDLTVWMHLLEAPLTVPSVQGGPSHE